MNSKMQCPQLLLELQTMNKQLLSFLLKAIQSIELFTNTHSFPSFTSTSLNYNLCCFIPPKLLTQYEVKQIMTVWNKI
jgi:hypothetical protein